MPRSIPDALPVRDVLGRSDVLCDLQRRLKESNEFLALTRDVLGPALACQISSGTLDETGWNLLAHSSAVAAKLRQRLPQIEAAIRQRGAQVNAIRVRVQSKRVG